MPPVKDIVEQCLFLVQLYSWAKDHVIRHGL